MPRLPGEVDPRFVNPPGGGSVPDHANESMDMPSEDTPEGTAVSAAERETYGALPSARLKSLFQAALVAKNQAAAAQKARDSRGEAQAARELRGIMQELNAELGHTPEQEPASVRDAVRGAVGK